MAPTNLDIVLAPDELLRRGLVVVGFTHQQINRVGRKKNISRFLTHYASQPVVYAVLLSRLQATDVEEAQIEQFIKQLGKEKFINYYFMAIHALACYPTENEAESAFIFKPCDKTWRRWTWAIIEKIACLKSEIIVWPSSWENPDKEDGEQTIFVITVDGTHCPILEPTHEDFSENSKFYSHKLHGAGLDYEIALSIFEQKCVWARGPFPAGKNDISIFRHKLKDKLLRAREHSGVAHRAIGDRGYRGERDLLSVPTSHDAEEVRDFKGRALSRQETFNSRVKNFDCMDERFRHGIEKHKLCFDAIVGIVQLQMENGSPLFLV